MTSVAGRALSLIDGSYITKDACVRAFERMHRRDRIGDRIHLAFACLGLFLLSGPTTVTEIAFAPMLVFFFVRAINTGPVWVHGFGQPSVLAALALTAWLGVTLLWSPDPAQGAEELSRMRWFVLLPLMFPAIERRDLLVRALAFGLIVATLAQLASAAPSMQHWFARRQPGRVTGWWDPVVCGTIQSGAVGLFLPGALAGAGRARSLGAVGLALSTLGLVASGTRGAWIAAAALVVISLPILWFGAGRAPRRGIATGAALFVVAGAVGAAVFRDGIARRVVEARQELVAAWDGELDSFTGARLAVMRAAFEAGVEHPLRGRGAGGVRTLMVERFGTERPALLLDHAHSTPMQLLAQGGFPALALGGLLGFVLLRNAARASPADPERALERGIPYAIGGVLLAGMFDVVLINMQVAALLGALAALAPAYRPVRVRSGAAAPVSG